MATVYKGIIEICGIKNFPSGNLNRDDTGSPKSVTFGGTTRNRFSSQSKKYSIRDSNLFWELLGIPKEERGIRTRRLPNLVANELKEKFSVTDDKVLKAVQEVVKSFGRKDGNNSNSDERGEDADTKGKKKSGKKAKQSDADDKQITTKQVIYISPMEITTTASVIHDILEECEYDISKFQKVTHADIEKRIGKAGVNFKQVSLDVAIFGRMVTSPGYRDIESALQVAHSMATHKTVIESDFFSTVDDLINDADNDDNGAGMIGDIDYTSACMFEYFLIDLDVLRYNIDNYTRYDSTEIIPKIVNALITCFCLLNPSGKQHSFAAHSLPSAVSIQVKDLKIPVNPANAFISGRSYDKNDYIRDSVQKLATELEFNNENFGIPKKAEFWFTTSKYSDIKVFNAEEFHSFNEMLSRVEEAIKA